MARPRFIEIDGKRYVWSELVHCRRAQLAAGKVEQPVLFELKVDCRPSAERCAADRYREPGLFTLLEQGD